MQAAEKKTVLVPAVPLYHVYKPNPVIAWSPSEAVVAELGDRVLSLRSDEGVPFALQGTIVAIHGSFVEVVFDADFMSGNSLNKRCSDQRGKVVALSSLLNLSKPRTIEPKSNAIVSGPVPTTSGSSSGGAPKKVWNTWNVWQQEQDRAGGRGGGRGGGAPAGGSYGSGGAGRGSVTIGACFNCGQTGHKSFDCPNPKGGVKPASPAVGHTAAPSTTTGSPSVGRGRGRGRGFGAEPNGNTNSFTPYKQSGGAAVAANRGSASAAAAAYAAEKAAAEKAAAEKAAADKAASNTTAVASAPKSMAVSSASLAPAASSGAPAPANPLIESLSLIAPNATVSAAPTPAQPQSAGAALTGDPLAFWNQLQQKSAPAPVSSDSAATAALKGMLNLAPSQQPPQQQQIPPQNRIQFRQSAPPPQQQPPYYPPIQPAPIPIIPPITVAPPPVTASSKTASAMRAQLRGQKDGAAPTSPSGEPATSPDESGSAAPSSAAAASSSGSTPPAPAAGGPPPLVPLQTGMLGIPVGMGMSMPPQHQHTNYLINAYGSSDPDPNFMLAQHQQQQQMMLAHQQRMAAQYAQFQQQQPRGGGRGGGRGGFGGRGGRGGRGGHHNNNSNDG